MAVDASLAGRTFPPTPPYEVTEQAVGRLRRRHRYAVPARRPGARDVPDRGRLRRDAGADGRPRGRHRAPPRGPRPAEVRPRAPDRGRRPADRDAHRERPAPDRRRRHHRDLQRDHRRRRARWSAPPTPPWSTRPVRDGRADPTTYPVTRADLVAYAAASGDPNPIHQDPEVARSVGLPDVIAHGMFTLALAARYVDEQLGEPGRIAELGAKFTKPVVVPESGTEVVVEGDLARRATRSRSASPAAVRRSSATRWRSCVPEAPRPTAQRPHDAAARWSGPRLGAGHDRGRARRGRTPGGRGRRAGARARRRQQPRGRRRGVRRHRGRGRDHGRPCRRRGRRRHLRGRGRRGGRRREPGTTSWRTAVERGWVGVEALSGIPGLGRRDPDPERRRLRPGGLPDDRLGARLGPDAPRRPHLRRRRLRVRLPHQPLQGRPRRHVVLDVTFQLRQGDARRRRWSTPSWPAPSASSRAARRRWPTYARPCSACARGKGMVLDPADHDTWSAGSFFTNPVRRGRGACPTGAPAWPQPDGRGEDQRGLADRARRLRQGVRRRAGARCPPSTRWR